jgi:hypothetical protein
MLTIALLLLLAINGAMFGAIVICSAIHAARVDQALEIAEKIWSVHWI